MPEIDPSSSPDRARSGNADESASDADARTCEVDEITAALIERLTTERDEALDMRRRALADFANFQRRANESEGRARDGGILFVARLLLPVLDQMDLALAQNTATLTVEQLLQAIAMVRSEMNKSLEKAGMERIAPQPGDEFNPHDHEAVMRQPAPGVAPNHIANCFQAGYRLGEMTLRPAKVSVTPE